MTATQAGSEEKPNKNKGVVDEQKEGEKQGLFKETVGVHKEKETIFQKLRKNSSADSKDMKDSRDKEKDSREKEKDTTSINDIDEKTEPLAGLPSTRKGP